MLFHTHSRRLLRCLYSSALSCTGGRLSTGGKTDARARPDAVPGAGDRASRHITLGVYGLRLTRVVDPRLDASRNRHRGVRAPVPGPE